MIVESELSPLCVDEELTLAELARFSLPSHRFPSDLYREFFSFEQAFCDAVRALEEVGDLPKRAPQTYRLWDSYYIANGLLQRTRTHFGDGASVGSFMLSVTDPLFLRKPPREWWPAIEAVRAGMRNERLALVEMSHAIQAGTANESDWEPRARALREQLLREIDSTAGQLPSDEAEWCASLRCLASLVFELRRPRFDNLSRLASQHLVSATELAQRCLKVDRRQLRDLVGRVNEDLRWPALSAAASSQDTKALDLATDLLIEELPVYNRAMSAIGALSPADVLEMLAFLAEHGLAQWQLELSIVPWHGDWFRDLSDQMRESIVHGRVRTMCALLEEAVATLADSFGGESFGFAVETQTALFGKVTKFVRGPDPDRRPHVIDTSKLESLNAAHNVLRDSRRREVGSNFASALSSSLVGYGMPSGLERDLVEFPSAEQVLAGAVFIRNLTSHQSPVSSQDRSTRWQEVWADHLPAINRTVRWAMLVLWSIAQRFPRDP